MRRFAGIATTLFACVTGCGSDELFTDAGTPLDSVPIDANGDQPDSGPPDAGPTTSVQVTTFALEASGDAPGTPEAGVSVIVVRPNGMPGTGGVTDANGELTLAVVEPGSSITVAYDDGTRRRLKTTMGVQPGDHLVYGDRYYSAPVTGVDGTMTVNFPNVGGTAVIYGARHRCGDDFVTNAAATSVTLTLSANCQTPTSNLFVYAADSSNEFVAAGFLDDQAYTNGSTSTLAAFTTVTPNNYTVTATGIPADVTGVSLRGHAYADELGDLSGYWNLYGVSAGMASFTTTNPGVGERTWSSVDYLVDGTVGDVAAFRAGAANATSATLPAPGVPRVGVLSADADLGAAGWVQGSGVYDGALLRVGWNQNESFYEDEWEVLFPPGVTTFSWNTVPAALQPHVPDTTDSVNGRVMLLDLGSATSYAELRAVPSWQLECPDCAVASGDQAAIDVAFDFGGGEGPMSFFRRGIRPPVARPEHAIDLRGP